MNEKISQFKAGLKDGIPIGLGYLAVSFTFGIMAKGAGLTTLEAVVLSFTNLTSAGQFAGLGIITAGSSLVEMAMAQLIINLRYCLMSCSLSQKLDSHMPFFHRFLMSYGVTDEIFGVSVCKSGVLSPYFSYGLMAMAVPGWTIGTLLGAVSGSLLPARLLSALNVALYGMFLAVVIPPARENKVLRMVILVSMALSFLFTQIPVLRDISSGFKIIILTVLVPVSEEESLTYPVYLYIAGMANVTYLIRMLPLTLIKKEIKNPFIRSFLYYVPYVTLSVMTFPAIIYATASPVSGAAALAVALFFAYKGKSLFQVSIAACAIVFILEFFV